MNADPPNETGGAGVRLDKWLWAVRAYKTRSLAIEACKAGHVKIAGQRVKPSHVVKVGEVITFRGGDLDRTFRVLGLIEKRVGAPTAKEYAEDLTPPSEYEKARQPVVAPLFHRPKGAGRPTKRDRRLLEHLGLATRDNDSPEPPAELDPDAG